MTDILACVDGSAFTESVCDHAAWFAGRTGAAVEIVHAVEKDAILPFRNGEALTLHAARRLRDNGVGEVSVAQNIGSLSAFAAATEADLIVMGKRGLGSEDNRRTLGQHVDLIVRGAQTPVCLTPRLFLPISRAVVLLDDDLAHRRAVEFVAAYEGLMDLGLSVVVIASDKPRALQKVEWARAALQTRDVEVVAVEAGGLDAAVARRMATHRSDLMVISRAVLLGTSQTRLQEVEHQGLWSWRTPVLVC